jgi:hypothetical protein
MSAVHALWERSFPRQRIAGGEVSEPFEVPGSWRGAGEPWRPGEVVYIE